MLRALGIVICTNIGVRYDDASGRKVAVKLRAKEKVVTLRSTKLRTSTSTRCSSEVKEPRAATALQERVWVGKRILQDLTEQL